MSDTAVRARAYGNHAGDLDVPFAAEPADQATTALLAACLHTDRDAVAGWSLARRLQALLAVRAADPDGAPLQAVVRCGHCGTRFELEIDPAACQREVDDTAFAWTAPDGRVLQLRLPSGTDLARWRAQGCTDPATLAGSLVCAVDDRAPAPGFALPSPWLGPLAAALAEHDPLGALQADAECPECAGPNATDIDLEALLLAGFARRQRRLLDEVATLARAFHWTEAQILALPAWRRAHYLARLDDDGVGLP